MVGASEESRPKQGAGGGELCDIDVARTCMGGPAVGINPECWCFDADNNTAIDLLDYTRFMVNFAPRVMEKGGATTDPRPGRIEPGDL